MCKCLVTLSTVVTSLVFVSHSHHFELTCAPGEVLNLTDILYSKLMLFFLLMLLIIFLHRFQCRKKIKNNPVSAQQVSTNRGHKEAMDIVKYGLWNGHPWIFKVWISLWSELAQHHLGPFILSSRTLLQHISELDSTQWHSELWPWWHSFWIS